MATLKRGTCIFQVPLEICGLICQDFLRRDLLSVRAVSRGFRDEAERRLFSCSEHRGILQIKAFCSSIVRRPYLGPIVRKLTLWMPPTLQMEEKDTALIVKALAICANLEHLFVFKDTELPSYELEPTGWILEGHPFRLKSFGNAYFYSVKPFLKQQDKIETLWIEHAARCDEYPFPNLRKLQCPPALLLFHTTRFSNLEQLQLVFDNSTTDEEVGTLAALPKFRPTLTYLSMIRRHGDRGLDLAVIFSCVVVQLPDIRHLRIIDHTTKNNPTYVPFLPFHLPFTKLESIIVQPPRMRTPDLTDVDAPGVEDVDIGSAYQELRTRRHRRATVDRLMRSIDTLKRVIIIGNYAYEYTRAAPGGHIEEIVTSAEDHETTWLDHPEKYCFKGYTR